VETWLAIASRRDTRAYTDAPVPPEVEHRILDAGRVSGSSRNTQKWQFVVVDAAKQDLAGCVYAPENVTGAALVIAIVGEAFPFDVGRCATNMQLAAWDVGVVSCPNGISDADRAAEICGGPVKMILSFGYPARRRGVRQRSADQWSARADRRSLDELVRRV
jgi:nitroreductase